jgi:hypothetical protein
LGVHPVAVDITLVIDKEIELYTKGKIQNKVLTVNKVHRINLGPWYTDEGMKFV